jgi:triosephosphate isomerase
VNKKLTAVLNNYPGITPVLCVGETEAGHEKGAAQDIIKKQLHKAFENIGGARAKRAVIAYEPVWAIGTGKNADGAYAKKIAGFIREEIKALYSESVAEEISVLYGGSMNALNIGAYLSDGAIDGGLVGGASLKPKEFIEMINKMSESEL